MPPDLSSRHRRTLAAIFEQPTPAGLKWAQVVGLLEAVGAEITERAGSRVAVKLGGRVNVIHRPHPHPEVPRATVRSIRTILEGNGVRPE